MITKLQLAAMNRVHQIEENRKDFYLYVDEFQNFATNSFIKILSEARKYRLNLTLANQYVGQIDEEVQKLFLATLGPSFHLALDLLTRGFWPKNSDLNTRKRNWCNLEIIRSCSSFRSTITLHLLLVQILYRSHEVKIRDGKKRYEAAANGIVKR